MGVIERSIPDIESRTQSATLEGDPSDAFDLEAALDRVEADEELLREIMVLFLEEMPSLMEDIRHAYGSRNDGQVKRRAHTLKGSVSNFGAHAAYKAAIALEKKAEAQDRGAQGAALNVLEREMERLQKALHDYLRAGGDTSIVA